MTTDPGKNGEVTYFSVLFNRYDDGDKYYNSWINMFKLKLMTANVRNEMIWEMSYDSKFNTHILLSNCSAPKVKDSIT